MPLTLTIQSPGRIGVLELAFQRATAPSGTICNTMAGPSARGCGQITMPILSSGPMRSIWTSKFLQQEVPIGCHRTRDTVGDGKRKPFRTFVDPPIEITLSPTSNLWVQHNPLYKQFWFHSASLGPTFKTSRATLSRAGPADDTSGGPNSATSSSTRSCKVIIPVILCQHLSTSSNVRETATVSVTSPLSFSLAAISLPSLHVFPPLVTAMIRSPFRSCCSG
mmetsp:Transcript_32676/g.53732  ORF Transcript_32676/g.53732 Transcript_32676/m.53732 type:complete len:222 (-) Transcript_32676:349-1014(-)